MPTAARFRTECVAALWDGTRFADSRARARMLTDAEAFVRDVNANAEYPNELVVDRVTRYRPEGSRVGSVVPGRALLHDMTAFILRLSRRDPVDASLRGGAMYASAVAGALNISARTLARFRSEGLVMHYVRDSEGRVRVACFPDAVDAFRNRATSRVQRAGRTVRMSADARTALLAWALAACGEGTRTSLHALATRLAPTVGCSVRTARSVLEMDAGLVAAVRLTQGGAVRPVQTAVRTPAWTRKFAARAVGFGFAPAVIAHRLGIAESAAARAALRGRAERLLQGMHGVQPLVLPVFLLPNAAESILAPPAVWSGLPVGPVRFPVPARVLGRQSRSSRSGTRASTSDGDAIVAAQSQKRTDLALAVAFRFLVWRAHEALMTLPKTPIARDVDAIERDLRWAHRVKRALLERVLPTALVPCVQRLGHGWDEVPEVLRMRWAVFAAIESARALDFSKRSSVAIESVHPSHVAAHAVERMIARGGPEFAPSNGDDAHALDDAVRRCVPWWHAICAGDEWNATAAQCDREHRSVVSMRFGLDGTAPRTFEEMGRELRVSASRATAMWYAAMHDVARGH